MTDKTPVEIECPSCSHQECLKYNRSHTISYRCFGCGYKRKKFSKISAFEKYLANRGYTDEDWENIIDIYGEYLIQDSDLYIFKHHFGLGKTTFGLVMLENGDIFLQATYTQLKENIEHFQQLRPQEDIEIIFGWETFIGLDGHTGKFKELQEIQKQHPQRIKKLQQLTNQFNGKFARLKTRKEEDKTPVLDKYAKKFEHSTWRNNIIFACSKKIDLIEQKTFLRSAEHIVIDEGIEDSFSSNELEDVQKSLQDLGQRNPQRPTLANQNILSKGKAKSKKREHLKKQTENLLVQPKNTDELLKNSPSFVDWSWCTKLTNNEMKKLGKLGRESLLGIVASGYSEDLSQGNDQVRMVHTERGPQNHTTAWGIGNFIPIKEFSKVWRQVAKKKRGGIDLENEKNVSTDYYPGDYSKFEKELRIQALKGNWQEVQRLQRFKEKAEFLHDIENLHVMVYPDSITQEITKVRYDIPLMFKLFDINEKNNQEILILDATTDEYYIEWIKRRWRNYHRNPNTKFIPEEKDIRFLGKNRDYLSLPVEAAANDIRRYYWDFNKRKETITRGLIEENFRKFRILVELIEKEDDEDTAIVSTKQFKKDFNTEDKVEEASYFAVSTGQNWNHIEKTFVIGFPSKPWEVYEEDFMRQYREYQSFNPADFKESLTGRDEIIEPEEWIARGLQSGHVDNWFHHSQRKIHNYWKRNIHKPVFDSYFRMRGGDRLNVIGLDRFNWIDKYGNGEKHYPISHLYAELMDEKYVIENWTELNKAFPNQFFAEYFSNIVTKNGDLRKPFRKYVEWISQGYNIKNILRHYKGHQTSSYYDWKKKYEKFDLNL